MPYLTPSSLPADMICRVLFIPNSPEWIGIVQGALLVLTNAANFEQYGSVTPEQCADVFTQMSDDFAYDKGVCRVVGEIILWAGSTSPDVGWLVCNGQSLLRSDYPELFAVIGTAFGAADGDHFSIPDLQNRVPMGVGTNALATTLGAATHTLTTAEMPTHSHSEGTTTPTAVVVGEIPAIGVAAAVGVTGNAGGGGAHNNIQPSIVLNFLIVAKP